MLILLTASNIQVCLRIQTDPRRPVYLVEMEVLGDRVYKITSSLNPLPKLYHPQILPPNKDARLLARILGSFLGRGIMDRDDDWQPMRPYQPKPRCDIHILGNMPAVPSLPWSFKGWPIYHPTQWHHIQIYGQKWCQAPPKRQKASCYK